MRSHGHDEVLLDEMVLQLLKHNTPHVPEDDICKRVNRSTAHTGSGDVSLVSKPEVCAAMDRPKAPLSANR